MRSAIYTMMRILFVIVLLATVATAAVIIHIEQPVAATPAALPVKKTEANQAKPAAKKVHRMAAKPGNRLNADSIAIHKAQRELHVFYQGQLVKTYKVALGINPIGAKEVEGDNKTPEGHYYIRSKNPLSRYYKSLGISYPNEKDLAHARELGQPAGGDIMIHGLMQHMNNKGKDHIKSDWTFGCIAVTNEEIDELFVSIKTGTPVFITP